MAKIGLKWKKQNSPVYMEEAAQLLDTTYEALRSRVHRIMNEGRDDVLPKPYKEPWKGSGRWAWHRSEFAAFVKAKKQLDKIVNGGKP